MSLCLVLQTKDVILMSADSRESVMMNGEFLATGKYVDKIHHIGDKVIFASGSGQVVSSIVRDFKQSSDQSITNLQRIAQDHKRIFIEQYGSDYLGKTHHADLFVGCFEEGKSALYGLSSKQDFEILKKVGSDSLDVACAGCHVQEATEFYRKHSQPDNDVLEMYQQMYNTLANEEIGGELTLYTLTNRAIEKECYPIIESRPIKTVLSSSKLMHNADEMSFYAEGKRVLWFDIPSRNFKFSGHLEAATGTFSGALQAATGTFSGDLQAAGGTFRGNLVAAGGTFSGALQAASGTFSGNLSAAGGTFTGTLVGVNGTFSGTLNAATINGGTINGTRIIGAEIMTSLSDYPRAVMSSSDRMFRAAASSSNSIEMRASGSNALSELRFSSGGAYANMSLPSSGTGLLLDGSSSLTAEFRSIYLRGYSGVIVPNWSVLKSDDEGESIRSALNKLAINLTFDSTTRNLKLWSQGGSLLAQVNIPK
ncbi:Fibronectin type III protein [compost metagenome]